MESFILSRQSVILSLSSRFSLAISIIPIIPFIGVRISWLIFDRNPVLAALDWIATASSICASFRRSRSVTSRKVNWTMAALLSSIIQLAVPSMVVEPPSFFVRLKRTSLCSPGLPRECMKAPIFARQFWCSSCGFSLNSCFSISASFFSSRTSSAIRLMLRILLLLIST